ncbi:hypothetical protein CAPTEDRAFT_98013 [Capitella teleta]|uniref:C1q domain-containing protein n=1 Tax=Capitella teleta TaxID=283909 RepID=R7T8M3_CAPTE|nr:hypothetical protein CAPTEDRAFT_98013 [Capitella teleta]|eukprot:ELT89753.1 hypothetical protein CAPTEDRAFT_98013 [Capitella teleta]
MRGGCDCPAVSLRPTAPQPHPQSTSIAFSATMDQDMPVSSEYRVVKYNIVLTNLGDAYSPHTGVFVAPCNGTFYVGFSGVSLSGKDVLLHLVRNGQRLLSAFDNSGCQVPNEKDVRQCSGMASNALVLVLTTGDKLWVELPDGYGLHNALYHSYSTFHGALVSRE